MDRELEIQVYMLQEKLLLLDPSLYITPKKTEGPIRSKNEVKRTNSQRAEVNILHSKHSLTSTSVQTKVKNGNEKYGKKSKKKGKVNDESRVEQDNKRKN